MSARTVALPTWPLLVSSRSARSHTTSSTVMRPTSPTPTLCGVRRSPRTWGHGRTFGGESRLRLPRGRVCTRQQGQSTSVALQVHQRLLEARRNTRKSRVAWFRAHSISSSVVLCKLTAGVARIWISRATKNKSVYSVASRFKVSYQNNLHRHHVDHINLEHCHSLYLNTCPSGQSSNR